MGITAIYAALCGLMMIGLAWLVVRQRHRTGVGIGAGGEAALERAVRAHGNFAEYVPLALLLLLLAETGGTHAAWLHANGAALLIARLLHGFGLTRAAGRSFGRFWGTAVTWLVIVALSLTNLVVWIGSG